MQNEQRRMNKLNVKVKKSEEDIEEVQFICINDLLAPPKTDFSCQTEFALDDGNEGFLFECIFNANPEFHSQEVATQVRISRNCAFLYLKSDVSYY